MQSFLFNIGDERVENVYYPSIDNLYKIKNLSKFGSDKKMIEVFSPIEKSVVSVFDENEDVIFWSHKDHIIPYINPVTDETELYVSDYYVICKNNKQTEACDVFLYEILDKENMIEEFITPTEEEYNELSEDEKDYMDHMLYKNMVNLEKYNTIKKYCRENGIKFYILDENNTLTIKDNTINKIN